MISIKVASAIIDRGKQNFEAILITYTYNKEKYFLLPKY